MQTPEPDPSHMLLNGEKPGWTTNLDIASSDGTASTADEKLQKRETWARKFDFLLACIGFSVGLGNVWRFPFLCYKNGGGAFLIPYFIAVVCGGIPVFFLEVSIGQFMSEGGIGPWKICPLFQGIGYASAIIVFFLNCNYNVILAWAFYYLFHSFQAVLPWSTCDNDWNSDSCRTFNNKMYTNNSNNMTFDESFQANGSVLYSTMAHNMSSLYLNTSGQVMDSVTEFWERKVLQLSSGVGSPGNLKWDLALCLLLAWIVVYFCIWKGIKSSGKVMYFTATSPYILMLVLLIRGVTLDGAMDGIKYYLLPDWSKLAEPQVWVDAGTQIFFSYSISLGTLTALGSYNKFNHNCYSDTMMFAAVNSGTSFLAGFVTFSVLGFMAKQQNVDISMVAESGPGLAFIAYPEAVAQMPVAPLWSVLFFLMVILLGLDSQFVGVEGLVTAVVDLKPQIFRQGKRREFLILGICLLAFAIGLSMVTQGGMYVFQLFDYYSASRIVLVVAFFECVVVAYIYGINRFYDNLEMMLGFRPGPFIKIAWVVITPVFTLSIFILGVISYSELEYKRKLVTYFYPTWAIAIGWCLALASIVFIPIIIIVKILLAKGSLYERICDLLKPRLHRHQLRENEDMSKVYVVDDIYTSTSASEDPLNSIEKLPMTNEYLEDKMNNV